jgi:hypothetical protein
MFKVQYSIELYELFTVLCNFLTIRVERWYSRFHSIYADRIEEIDVLS